MSSDNHRVPSQSEYEQETADERWVALEDADGEFRVREVAPLKLLRDMRKYGVEGLLGGDDGDVDMGQMLQDGQFDAFLDDVVLPNILDPACFWSDPVTLLSRLDDDQRDELVEQHTFEAMSDQEARGVIDDVLGQPTFDLAALTATDLMAVITGMTGQDQDDLQERMDEQFQG